MNPLEGDDYDEGERLFADFILEDDMNWLYQMSQKVLGLQVNF